MSSFCTVKKEDIWLTIIAPDGDMIRFDADAAPQLIGDLLMALGTPIPPEVTSSTIEAPDADLDALRSLGKEWIKASTRRRPGMHRIYFEPLSGWYGLQIEANGSTRFRGESCPILEGMAIVNRFMGAKVYYNVHSGRFCGERINQEDFEFIVEQIRALERRQDEPDGS